MEFDPQALDQYRRKLRHKVCYHLGGFCPDVDDVVQETMVRFIKALKEDRIHNPASIGAFLSGVCNNVILEYRRNLWTHPTEPESPGPEPQVSPDAETFDLREEINAALSEMSSRDCHILRAFFLQEKDKDVICRETGLSEAQFRVALFRAKDRFRKIYRQGLKHPPSGNH